MVQKHHLDINPKKSTFLAFTAGVFNDGPTEMEWAFMRNRIASATLWYIEIPLQLTCRYAWKISLIINSSFTDESISYHTTIKCYYHARKNYWNSVSVPANVDKITFVDQQQMMEFGIDELKHWKKAILQVEFDISTVSFKTILTSKKKDFPGRRFKDHAK